jgi:hypothetical protein
MRLLVALLLLAFGAVQAEAAKQPEPDKQLRDWWVACNNLRVCWAFGFRDSLNDFRAHLRIVRAAEANAVPEVEIYFQHEGVGKHSRLKLSFDDASLGGLPAEPLIATVEDDEIVRVKLPPALVPEFLASVRKAAFLTVEDLGTPQANEGDDGKARISMSGATASLLFMDERQKRVGTVTALAAKGDKPASAVPAPPAMPEVRLAQPYKSSTPLPKTPPKAVLNAANKIRASDFEKENEPEPIVARLSASKTLWGLAVEMPAYNYRYAFYILENGRVRPAEFYDPTGARDSVNEVTLPELDPATNVIKTFYRGRGLGDCGGITEWGWDGEKFREITSTMMVECRGVRSERWPMVFRASPQWTK